MNTPDKCPACNATLRTDHASRGFVTMRCGSHYGADGTRMYQGLRCIEEERDQLAARVKRLEEAGDRLATQLHSVSETEWISVGGALDAWTQAKEAKP